MALLVVVIIIAYAAKANRLGIGDDWTVNLDAVAFLDRRIEFGQLFW